MVRIRQGWLVAALALSVSAGACKKKDENKAPAAGSAQGSAQTTPTPAEKPAADKPATPAAAGASDDLSLLPVDSEVVMGINFAQLQKSELWKKFVEPQLMKAEVQEKLAKFKDACNMDPMTAITGVSIGVKGVGASTPDGVFVVHGLAKDKSLACFDKFKAEAEKDGSKVTVDGDVILFTKDTDTVGFTFVGSDTLLAVVGANANTAGVKAAAAGGSALKTSPAFVEMYGKIKSQDSVWLLMNGNSKAFDQFAGALGSRPKALFGSVNVTDGLTADMNVRMETAEKATAIASMVNQQAAQIKPMVDKFDVATDAADVKVSVGLSAAKLAQLSALIPH